MKKTIITIGKRVSTFISIKVLKFRTKELCYAATLILCLSNGAMAQVCFTPSSGSPFAVGNYPQLVISADFNGDGYKDLAVANQISDNVSILFGIGAGTFATAPNYAVGAQPQSVTAADFNNDGKIDLATANYGSNNVSILLGTGTGSFGTATNFTVGTAPYSVTAADFNNDSKIDLAVADYGSNNVSILLGTGTGTFGAATNFAVGAGPQSVIATDFNGDGYKDLAVANDNSGNVSILLGTGTGSFGGATNFLVGTNPRSVIAADFNGDTKPDIAVANSGSNNVSILLGTGSGLFGPATSFTVGTGPYSVTVADFNGDTKPDLATANEGEDSVSVLLGTGTGSFGGATNFLVGASPVSVTAADFNNDGKLDLATANYTNNVSVILSSQLTVSITPTNTTTCAGGSATLTASGATSYTWSTGAVATGIIVNPTVTTIYTVDGPNACGTGTGTATSTVTVNALPTVTVNSATICALGSTATLTAGGASTYSWMPGGATGSSYTVNPTVTSTYTVTGVDVHTCVNTATGTVTVLTVATPAICMISTDSVTNYQYNVVYWNKTGYSHVDSFLVYRYDAVSTHYLHIGSVSNAVLSEFTDTAFSISGPNGGNPQYGAWKYKLAIRDTCGNIGALSPYHSSIFVQESGSNFSWTQYIDSGYASLPTGYSFLRDDNNTGSWTVLANLGNTATSTTDPNYASYPNANWRVDALGFNCTPTLRLSGNNSTDAAKIKSHSNINNNRTSGINRLEGSNEVTIYPNPANGIMNLKLKMQNGNTNLVITDMLGNIVKQSIIYNPSSIISVADLAEGIYNVSISSNEGVVNKRLVIVR